MSHTAGVPAGFEPITSDNTSLEFCLFGYKATTLLTCAGTYPVRILARASTIMTEAFVAFLTHSKQMTE
jgi:hypothetical protein